MGVYKMSHIRKIHWTVYAAILVVVGIVIACNRDTPTTAPVLDWMTIQLHWIPDPDQAGFWVALVKGLYKDAGIDATVLPGGLDSNPIKAAISGNADLAQ